MIKVPGEASLGDRECCHLYDRGIVSIGDLKSEMPRIISATSDPGPLISPPALRTRGRGACALSHTHSPGSPTPPCPALAAAWITQQRSPPPQTVTYPLTATPELPRSLPQGASALGNHLDLPLSIFPQTPHLRAFGVPAVGLAPCPRTVTLPDTMGQR